MSPLGVLIILIVFALPVAWLASEFRGKRWVRIFFGVLAIVGVSLCAWGLSYVILSFNYNSYYGTATADLIRTSLLAVENGHIDRVLKVWRGLDQQYQPTYENRANYQGLVSEAKARLRGDQAIEPGSAWDAPAVGLKTWAGHWEDGSGYWIVVRDGWNDSLSVVRSGDGSNPMHSVSVSADGHILRFKEGNQWQHTLTLKSKYEVTAEWRDLNTGAVWDTRTMYKLIQPSEEQKVRARQVFHETAR